MFCFEHYGKIKGNNSEKSFLSFFLRKKLFYLRITFLLNIISKSFQFQNWGNFNWIKNIRNLLILQTCFDCMLCITLPEIMGIIKMAHATTTLHHEGTHNLRKEDKGNEFQRTHIA